MELLNYDLSSLMIIACNNHSLHWQVTDTSPGYNWKEGLTVSVRLRNSLIIGHPDTREMSSTIDYLLTKTLIMKCVCFPSIQYMTWLIKLKFQHHHWESSSEYQLVSAITELSEVIRQAKVGEKSHLYWLVGAEADNFWNMTNMGMTWPSSHSHYLMKYEYSYIMKNNNIMKQFLRQGLTTNAWEWGVRF